MGIRGSAGSRDHNAHSMSMSNDNTSTSSSSNNSSTYYKGHWRDIPSSSNNSNQDTKASPKPRCFKPAKRKAQSEKMAKLRRKHKLMVHLGPERQWRVPEKDQRLPASTMSVRS